MGRYRDVRAFPCPSPAEFWLVQKSVPWEIYGNKSTDQCSGSGASCSYDLPDGKRDHNVPPCVRISSDHRRDGNGKAGAYGSLLLGVCADGTAPGTPLGDDDGKTEEVFRNDKIIQDPLCALSDLRYRDCRIRSLCIHDKRSGDLHVSEDTICFPGLQ